MKNDYYAGYREYLREGMRIETGIPLSGGGTFRDWAVVIESGQDQLLAQISRDVLPANVRVDVGCILDVSVSIKQEVYTCSGIVTDKLGGRVLRIQLFGSFSLRERRRFFRIDLNLSVKYAIINDASRSDVEKDWVARKDLEHMNCQGYDEFAMAVQKARFVPRVKLDWHEMLWAEVNLGGGGLGIGLPEAVKPDQLICLDIQLPLTPPRQIQAVAEVLAVKPKEKKGGGVYYDVGMQFAFLDERDRNLIFQHISVSQIAHLRKVADRRDIIDLHEGSGSPARWQQGLRRALWGIITLTAVFYLVSYLIQYRQTGPPNQIQKTYEKAIRQYRQQGN